MSVRELRVVAVDDEPLALSLLCRHVERLPGLRLVGRASTGEEAVRVVSTETPDLVLLDIVMPRLDGFGVLERLREEAEQLPKVIFCTAHDRYAARAFEVNAVDYVRKPVTLERLGRAVEKLGAGRRDADLSAAKGPAAWDQLLADLGRHPIERLLVRDRGAVRPIPLETIDWLEADGDYVRVHAAGRSPLVDLTLNRLEALLEGRGFLRVHRGAIVRLDAVEKLHPLGGGRYEAVLRSAESVLVSRTYAPLFRRALL